MASDKTVERAAVETDPNLVVSNRSNQPVTPLNIPLQNHEFSIQASRAEEVEKAITAIRYHYRPPTFNQPSKALPEALDNAFITHYVELNRAGKSRAPEVQWIGHLQSIFGKATKPVVKISLRAVSMAFYGKYHNDPSITIDSWRWYNVALNAQRSSIARMKKNTIPDEGEVLVPIILALYELYAGATAAGSTAHLNAAGEIMKMRGPSNCRSGAIWPIFKAIRAQDAHRSVFFNKRSPYSSPEWLTIPFLDMPKDPHQVLADIQLMIPHCTACLGIEGSLRIIFETIIPPDVDVTPGRELACRLIADLDNWAKENADLIKPSNNSGDTSTPDSSSQPAKGSSPRAPTNRASGSFIRSTYMANGLILNMLMYKIQTESKAPIESYEKSSADYASIAQGYSQAIIQFATEMEKAHTPGFHILRCIPLVLIVAYCAPTMDLRNVAKTIIFGWTSRFNGVASVLDRL
ncbi:hypothetical protein yc1106_06885 [Curvularia clavata]|uniref:Uncharacterized protein n=1 Tax=Curvularia clavata TaxID=95742 RepID=A0A9Q9DVN4_CURCL|nr:hypothetical protein yc1106_06885 [Curvularia clavata]